MVLAAQILDLIADLVHQTFALRVLRALRTLLAVEVLPARLARRLQALVLTDGTLRTKTIVPAHRAAIIDTGLVGVMVRDRVGSPTSGASSARPMAVLLLTHRTVRAKALVATHRVVNTCGLITASTICTKAFTLLGRTVGSGSSDTLLMVKRAVGILTAVTGGRTLIGRRLHVASPVPLVLDPGFVVTGAVRVGVSTGHRVPRGSRSSCADSDSSGTDSPAVLVRGDAALGVDIGILGVGRSQLILVSNLLAVGVLRLHAGVVLDALRLEATALSVGRLLVGLGSAPIGLGARGAGVGVGGLGVGVTRADVPLALCGLGSHPVGLGAVTFGLLLLGALGEHPDQAGEHQ